MLSLHFITGDFVGLDMLKDAIQPSIVSVTSGKAIKDLAGVY